jgi:hypothetical protein
MSRGPDANLHPPGNAAAPTWAASPAATRTRRPRWRDPRLVIGVAVVALCTVLGARLVGGADDTAEVWAARGALHEGQPVVSSDLVRRQVRFTDQADADRYVSPSSRLPRGARLTRPVGAGELVPRGALGNASAGSLTEVPLSVGTDAVPTTVRVGATVDVWVTPDGSASDPAAGSTSPPGPAHVARSTLVFDDVAVVSVPRAGEALGPTATRQVIVGVGADQTTRLPTSIAALASGTVVLTEQR